MAANQNQLLVWMVEQDRGEGKIPLILVFLASWMLLMDLLGPALGWSSNADVSLASADLPS